MAEVYTLIDGKEFSYEGIFNLQKLYKIIDTFFKEHHWNKNEIKNFEQVEPKGRQVVLEIMPWRTFSDYCKEEIRVFMIASELKDVDVTIDGVKRRLQQGKLFFSFDAYLHTDRKKQWEGRPLLYFFRIFVDKFVRKGYVDAAKSETIRRCNELQDVIKSYLNLHRYLTSREHATPRKA
ncbi:hypothetical protein D6783_03565 [Candidatus Woesearchaeota archaeon]|nr:MAG: hypothetical protein D6783_03565 [Candidatus Woesearchaeota archaeon]